MNDANASRLQDVDVESAVFLRRCPDFFADAEAETSETEMFFQPHRSGF